MCVLYVCVVCVCCMCVVCVCCICVLYVCVFLVAVSIDIWGCIFKPLSILIFGVVFSTLYEISPLTTN